jgi:hypothetical protein
VKRFRAIEQTMVSVATVMAAAAASSVPVLPLPAVVSRRQQQGGYCEICECPFTDLYDHLSSR